MILALMLYSVAISMLLAAAAVACERTLRLTHRAARFVWVGAMLAAVVFTATRFQSGLSATPSPMDERLAAPAVSSTSPGESILATETVRASVESGPGIAEAIRDRVNAARISVVSGSAWERLDTPLLVAWLTLATVGLLVIGVAALRLARPRPRWSTTIVDGVPVLLSHDLGPAVVGLFRYRIVLPAWVLALEPKERDLVLVHEREHAAAGDPSLLFVATVLMALCPWNAPLWWMARRLRFAIELDCDARVLRRRPDRTAYGALLIDVSERTLGGAMPVAALAESVSLIERRITAMSSGAPRLALLRSIAAAACTATLVAVACVAPRPTRIAAPSIALARTAPAALGTRDAAIVPREPAVGSRETTAPPRRETRHTTLSDGSIKSLLRYGTAGIINPMLMILRDAESLGLTAKQADSVATLNRWYRVRLDAIWSPVARYYLAHPSNDQTIKPSNLDNAPDATLKLLTNIAPAITALLTAEQRGRLPALTASYLDSRSLNAMGEVFAPGGGVGMGRGARGRSGGGM